MRLEGLKGAIYKRGKVWYIDYSVDGKQHREAKGIYKRHAITALQKKNVEIAEGKHLDKRPSIRFEDFSKEYLDIYSPQIRSGFKDEHNMKSLNKFFGGKYLDKITNQDVELFKLSGSASPIATNRRMALLRALFNRAISHKKITENPVKNIKFYDENKRLRYLNEDETELLLKTCSDERLKIVLIIALYTGLRKTELFSLKWEDVDFVHGVIRVLRGKNGETRFAPMNSLVRETLENFPRHPKNPYIFYMGDEERQKDIRKEFDKLLKECKIKDFHFHDLRHTFASQLVMKGIDLYTVAQLLGHKSLEMTTRYSHLSPEYLRKAVERAENSSTKLAHTSVFDEQLIKHGLK